jgi:hypothetical protein
MQQATTPKTNAHNGGVPVRKNATSTTLYTDSAAISLPDIHYNSIRSNKLLLSAEAGPGPTTTGRNKVSLLPRPGTASGS